MATIQTCHNPQAARLDESFVTRPAALPLVSVIVAVYNQLEYTKQFVASLEQNADCAYELILIDNGSTDGTAEWARKNSIRVHRWHANQGVPVAYNEGVKLASGPLLCFMNNDMTVHPGGLRRLAEASYARGMAAQSGGVWGLDGSYAGQTNEAHWSDYAEGYALVFQREVWERTGQWDTSLFPSYGDDCDWVMRARLKGYDYRLVPNCVHHFGQVTSSGMALNPTVRKHQRIIEERYLPLGLGVRTLVLRYAAAGDILMTTPVFRALKREMPLSRVHAYVHPGCGMVLAGNPHVDHRGDGVLDPKRYSRVVNLIGTYEEPQKKGVWDHPVTAYCREAGVPFDHQPYDFYLPDAHREWARKLLPEVPFKYIACGVRSGTRPKQNWRPSGWMELAQALPKGMRLVALDSAPRPPLGSHGPCPDDERFYDHPNVLDLTGATETMHHAGALIERCAGFVGVDSGLLHVASALGKPTVTLCAAAPLAARMPLVGKADGFEGEAACFSCQYRTPCPERAHCLDWVKGEWVAEKIGRLVA